MLTDAVSARLTTAAHLNNRLVAKPVITARDLRIRGWSKTNAGAHTEVGYDFVVALTGDGNVLRVRTIATDLLDVAYATPSGAMVWTTLLAAAYSGAAIPAAKQGYGVAIFVSGANVDLFYVHSDGVTIKKISSTDNGHTWGAASTVVALSAQMFAVYLAAPASNVLFIADSNGGLTTIKVAIYSGGAWTVSSWDYAAMSITNPSEIYGSGQFANPFAVVSLGSNDYLIVMFARAPRGFADDGIYTLRVSNVAAGATPFWQPVEPLFVTNAGVPDQTGNIPQRLYVAFPKMQIVGSEYWITALEVSAFAGHAIQHLVMFRSPDGVNWVDRGERHGYLAGTDLTYDDGGAVAFALDDLLGGQVLISGNYIYLFAYDSSYRAAATMLCGVDNAAKKLDLSDDIAPPITIQRPAAGQSASVTLSLLNPTGAYNDSTIVRRGAQITIEGGYYTDAAHGEERISRGVFLIDEMSQGTSIDENGSLVDTLELTCRDQIKVLQDPDSKFDVYSEYFGPAQTHLSQIDDTFSLDVLNGTFFASNGELHGGMVSGDDTIVDNLAVLAHARGVDGFTSPAFKCLGAWTGSYFYVALVNSKTDYLAVMYDGTNFTLKKASPTAAGSQKILAYGSALATNAVALSLNTRYYLRVQVLHHTLQAWYSTDLQNWTRALAADYISTPTDAIKWGIGVLGRVDISTPRGENRQPADVGLSGIDYAAFLNDANPMNLGKAMSFFERIKTGQAGIFRGISVCISRWESSASRLVYVPDVTIQIWKDYGDGTKPASLSDAANKLYEVTLSPTDFDLQISERVAWKALQINDAIANTAETYYWICVKSAGNMTLNAGGTAMLATPMALMYVGGALNGGYKCLYQYNPADLTDFYDFSPNPGGANSTFSMFVQTSFDASGIVVQQIDHSGGEPIHTIESVAQSIVAKAGVTDFDADAWIDEPFAALDTGADGTAHNFANNQTGTWAAAGALTGFNASATTWAYLRTNTYLGLLGDGVISFKVTINASGKRAGMLLRAVGDPASLTSAYRIDLTAHATAPVVTLSKIVAGTATVLYATPSIAPIPVGVPLRVKIISNAGALSVYIENLLAATFWDTSITPQGSIGFAVYGNNGGGSVASFDDLRVADVWKVKDYFAIQPKESAQQALARLIGKDRIKYFMRSTGALRLSSFSRRAVVDTYSATIIKANLVDTDRQWISDVQPQSGDAFARRFDAIALDLDGHRFGERDYGDSASDEQAWDDGALPLREAREASRQYSFTSACVPAAEQEDVIAVTNPLDGVSENFVIDSLEETYDIDESGSPTYDQTPDLRACVTA